MSYNTIVLMASDQDLIARFVACASQEGIVNPEGWATSNRWSLAGFDQGAVDAYQYAIDAGDGDDGDIGKSEAVVTDGMILSIVQTYWASQQPPPE